MPDPYMVTFVYFFLMLGLITVLYKSTLFDPIRRFLMTYVAPSSPFKDFQTLANLGLHLVNCWICLSFWSGIVLSLLHMIPLNNPIIAGFYAVGLMSLFKFSPWGEKF